MLGALEPRVVKRIRAVSSLGTFLDGYNLTIIAVALIPLSQAQRLSTGVTGLLASAMLLGSVAGGLMAGFLADRWGRRTLLIGDLVVFIIFSFISALVTHYSWLVVARFIVGLAVGADYAISPTYLAECAPKESRGYQLGYLWVAWSVGAVASYGIGAALVAILPVSLSWRVLFALAIIPAMVGLFMRTQLPESPTWHANMSRKSPATRSLSWRGSGLGRAWALALLPWFFMDLATYGLGLLLPDLLRSGGLATNTGAILGTGLAALCGGLGSLWAMFRLDRMGRIRLQAWGFGLAAIVSGILAILLWEHIGAAGVLVLGLMVANFVNGVGPGVTAGMIPAEVFPTSIRASAQGVATAFSRVGAVVGVFALSFSEAQGGFGSVLMVTAVACFLGMLCTWVFRVEPNQRSLSDDDEAAPSPSIV